MSQLSQKMNFPKINITLLATGISLILLLPGCHHSKLGSVIEAIRDEVNLKRISKTPDSKGYTFLSDSSRLAWRCDTSTDKSERHKVFLNHQEYFQGNTLIGCTKETIIFLFGKPDVYDNIGHRESISYSVWNTTDRSIFIDLLIDARVNKVVEVDLLKKIPVPEMKYTSKKSRIQKELLSFLEQKRAISSDSLDSLVCEILKSLHTYEQEYSELDCLILLNCLEPERSIHRTTFNKMQGSTVEYFLSFDNPCGYYVYARFDVNLSLTEFRAYKIIPRKLFSGGCG